MISSPLNALYHIKFDHLIYERIVTSNNSDNNKLQSGHFLALMRYIFEKNSFANISAIDLLRLVCPTTPKW